MSTAIVNGSKEIVQKLKTMHSTDVVKVRARTIKWILNVSC